MAASSTKQSIGGAEAGQSEAEVSTTVHMYPVMAYKQAGATYKHAKPEESTPIYTSLPDQRVLEDYSPASFPKTVKAAMWAKAANAARNVPRQLRKNKATAAVVLGSSATVGGVAFCSADHISAPDYGWSHYGAMSAYDYGSIRRGFQVYREVCASCHALEHISFRNLIGITHTEAEVKKIAESYDIMDGPNDEGEMFERPGKLADRVPGPYPNMEAARAANNGAYPPDLSLMVKARPGGVDYVFALLTGYIDPPVGKVILSGLNYNPYFPGGAIAMARQLMDGQIEYEDGTPATTSQMAKDVSTFLAWAAEPEHDYRKRAGVQWIGAIMVGIVLTAYYKRFKWSIFKTAKFHYVN